MIHFEAQSGGVSRRIVGGPFTGREVFLPGSGTDIAWVGWGSREQIAQSGIGQPGGDVPQMWLTGWNGEVPPVFQQFSIGTKDVKRIMRDGRSIGMIYEDAHARYAFLTGVLPTDLTASREAQTTSVFENIEAAVAEAGMTFAHVVRTWLYMENILAWYDPFNRARDAFFRSRGVYDGLVPASTGIGTGNLMDAAITACALAVLPKHADTSAFAVSSPLQCTALDYGSSFSRAAEIDTPDQRVLLISGTASIEPGGATAFVDDIDRQIALSMDVVEAILQSRGMNWRDTVRGVAYLKRPEYRGAWRSWLAAHGLEDIAISEIVADVCRDNLLFEVELDAVRPNS